MSMVNVSNLGFGGTGIPDSLPKAVAELQGLTLSVVTGAAAGTVMPVAGMDPEDTIGSAVNLTDLTSVDVTTLTISRRNATAVISCLTTAVDGNTVTVNGKVYTFKDIVVHTSYNPPPGVIPIDITPSGSDQEEMAERLAKAIMSGDSTVTATVEADTASPPLMSKVRVYVRQAGVAGNAYTLTETGTAVTVSGATFTGGAAAATGGFTSSASLAGKKIMVLWYDKVPGSNTETEAMPMMARAMRFRAGKQEEVGPDVGRGDDDRDEDGRDDDGRDDPNRNRTDTKPGPGKPKTGR